MITQKQIDDLIANTLNTRDAALIALMADGPFRTHELVKLRVKHLDTGIDPHIEVPYDTKTGCRRIPLVNSIPYLRRYTETFKDLKPEDPLFLNELWNTERKPMTTAGINAMLRKVAKRAGVPLKLAHAYGFRHRWNSIMAPKISNAVLEDVNGWVPGSKQHRRYQHLNPSHIDDAIRKAYGQKPKETEEQPLEIKKVKCSFCGREAPKAANYCEGCGRALRREVALMDQEKLSMSREMFIAFMKDPEVKKELKEYRKGKPT
jgi:integrase